MITIVGPIPAEYRHAEWGEVFPPFYITDRMRDGRYKGAVYDPGPFTTDGKYTGDLKKSEDDISR